MSQQPVNLALLASEYAYLRMLHFLGAQPVPSQFGADSLIVNNLHMGGLVTLTRAGIDLTDEGRKTAEDPRRLSSDRSMVVVDLDDLTPPADDRRN